MFVYEGKALKNLINDIPNHRFWNQFIPEKKNVMTIETANL